MEENKFIKMNLQLFAEPGQGDDAEANVQDGQERTYSQEELEQAKEELKKQLLSKHEKELEKARADSLSEAQRLSKLSEEQKNAEQYKKLEEEVNLLRKEKEYTALKEETLKLLEKENLSSGFVSFVMDENADKIKEKVSSLKKFFDEQVQIVVEERLKGKTPQAGNASTKMTKEEILSIENAEERLKAISENIDLFQF